MNDLRLLRALRGVRQLEKLFIRDAIESSLNQLGWGTMFHGTIHRFGLHNLPNRAYLPFAVFNYIATRGLQVHMKHLLHAAGVDIVPLPLAERAALQRNQIEFGVDVLHALVQAGIEQWPHDRRAEVFDYVFTETPVSAVETGYEVYRAEVLTEVARINGRRTRLRNVLHFADGAAQILSVIAPDAYVDDKRLNWGAGI